MFRANPARWRAGFPPRARDHAAAETSLSPPAPSDLPSPGLTIDRSPARRRRPSPQLAVKRAVSTKAVADSKISTDEVLKTIADKVRRLAPTPHMPTIGSRQDLVPPQEKNRGEITVFAVELSPSRR